MANEKEDEFALTKPNGLPAYPKMIHRPTVDKNQDGSPVMDLGTVVNNPEEHKKLLNEKGAPAWGKDK